MRRRLLLCYLRGRLPALLLSLFSSLLLTQSASATDVGGTIGSQTWTPAGNPYHVVSTVTLSSTSATLTIQAGTIIKFNPGTSLVVNGTLSAQGSLGDSVIFTSWMDDSYGGDSNGDLGATVGSRGDWGQIRFSLGSTNTGLLRYCVVRYAGSGGVATIQCDGADGSTRPTIRECRIELGAGAGLSSINSGPKLYNSMIQLHQSYAVLLTQNCDVFYRTASEPSLPDVVFQHNGVDGIGVAAGSVSVSGSSTWRKAGGGLGYPYVAGGAISVPLTRTLNIEAGVILKMPIPAVELTVAGTLLMNGTGATPIIVTSIRDDAVGGDTNHNGTDDFPSPGDWGSLHFSGTGTAASQITGVIFKYGGGGPGRGQLWCDNTGNSAITNVRIEGCRFLVDLSPGGVYTNGSNPRIVNCCFIGPANRLAVQNATSTITPDATNNWWNDPSGPYDASAGAPDQNPGGIGAGVSDFVSYRPWLLSCPSGDPAAAVSPVPLTAAAPVNGTANVPLTISNSGEADLSFQISEAAGPAAVAVGEEVAMSPPPVSLAAVDVPWISENPTSGRVGAGGSGQVSVIFNATGLASARYTSYLLVVTNDPANPQVVVPVVFDVGAPASPSELTVTPGNIGSSLQLQWNRSLSAGVTGYRVYRSNLPGQLGQQVALLGDVTAYRDDELDDNGTYYYTVRAVGAGGLESPNTTQASGTAHDAVVLVHGLLSNHTSWDVFAPYLSQQGFTVYGDLDLTPNVLAPEYVAGQLQDYLNARPERRFNIVAHSMGGLVAREMIARSRFAPGGNKVGKLVMIGTPNHGSEIADLLLPFNSLWRLFLLPEANPLLFGVEGAGPALTTGSSYLNALNYGGGQGDPVLGGSCHTFGSEAAYFPEIEYYTIAGTAQECGFYNWALRNLIWQCPSVSGGIPRDGLVSTNSARLRNPQSQGWVDVELGLEPLSHGPSGLFKIGYLCNPRQLQSVGLAGKVTNLLRGIVPPVPALAATPSAIVDAEPVLSVLPPRFGSLSPGDTVEDSILVTSTSMIRFLFLADQTGLSLRLRTPTNQTLGPADTLSYPGLDHEQDPLLGVEGFEVVSPTPGVWKAILTGQSNTTPASFQLERLMETGRSVVAGVQPGLAAPNAPVLLTAYLEAGELPVAADSVTAQFQHDGGSIQSVRLRDDGLGGDATAGDFIHGSSVVPGAGAGAYSILFTAWFGGLGITAGGVLRVEPRSDLEVIGGVVRFASFPDAIGDTVTVKADIRNIGALASQPIGVQLFDATNGIEGATETLPSLAPGEQRLVTFLWTVVPPDTHFVRVVVDPFSDAAEASYANNFGEGVVHIGFGATDVSDAEPPAVTTLLRHWPSPASRSVSFSVAIAPLGHPEFEIFDIAGRRVLRQDLSSRGPGVHTIIWDRRDASGAPVSAGVYFARLRDGNAVTTRRLVMLR